MVPALPASNFVSAEVLKQVTDFGGMATAPGFALFQKGQHPPHKFDFTGGADVFANWQITGWRFDPCATNPDDVKAHGGSSIPARR